MLALPLAWTALWSEVFGASLAASVCAWSALSKLGAGVAGQAINLERFQTMATAGGLDEAVRGELEALEESAERLTHVGERTLADAAGGGPIFSFPD